MRTPQHLKEVLTKKDVRGTIIVRNESHPGVQLEVRIEPVGRFAGGVTPSGRVGYSSSGNMFYNVKERLFSFGGLTPGTYKVSAKLNQRQYSQQVQLEPGQSIKLSACIGHSGGVLSEEELLQSVTCVDTLFAEQHPDLDFEVDSITEKRIAPTTRYLSSQRTQAKSSAPRGRKHMVFGPVTIWKYHPTFSQYKLPLDLILQRETDHLDSHVPVYTATSFEKLVLQDFLRELVRQAFPDSEKLARVWWVRNPLDLPARFARYEHIWDLIYVLQGPTRVNDNLPNQAWMLQSCNPHLFGNTLVDSEESTVDYYYDGMSVIQVKIIDLVIDFLTRMKLIDSKCASCTVSVKTWRERLKAALELAQPKEPPRGVLFQVFIPHERVNQVAYISKTNRGNRNNGQPDEDNTNALETLLRIQTDGAHQVPNYSTLQVRLLVPYLMHPDNELRVFRYTNASEDAMRTFHATIATLVNEVLSQARGHISGPSHGAP